MQRVAFILTVRDGTNNTGSGSRNNGHCEQCTKAGAKTPTFPSPVPDMPPYHTQMFLIKSTYKPLHPEYVNQDKEPFRWRDWAWRTLPFSFSVSHNTPFQSANRLFPPSEGVTCGSGTNTQVDFCERRLKIDQKGNNNIRV